MMATGMQSSRQIQETFRKYNQQAVVIGCGAEREGNDSRSESLNGWMILLFIMTGSSEARSFLGKYHEFSSEHVYFEVPL